MTRIRLRAKRRWGELLPEPEPKAGPGRGKKTRDSSSQVSDADRKSAERARKLAAIPKETFEAALERSDKPPSEAALIRMEESGEPPTATEPAEPTGAQRRLLDRLDSSQAQENAWRGALDRAKADQRPVADADVRFEVEQRLPKTHPLEPDTDAVPAPAQVAGSDGEWRTPVHEANACAASCSRHSSTIEALLAEIGPAVMDTDPQTAKEWHERFGELADLAARLTEETHRAIKTAEGERSEGKRIGIEVR
jgi:hypothetical protein